MVPGPDRSSVCKDRALSLSGLLSCCGPRVFESVLCKGWVLRGASSQEGEGTTDETTSLQASSGMVCSRVVVALATGTAVALLHGLVGLVRRAARRAGSVARLFGGEAGRDAPAVAVVVPACAAVLVEAVSVCSRGHARERRDESLTTSTRRVSRGETRDSQALPPPLATKSTPLSPPP